MIVKDIFQLLTNEPVYIGYRGLKLSRFGDRLLSITNNAINVHRFDDIADYFTYTFDVYELIEDFSDVEFIASDIEDATIFIDIINGLIRKSKLNDFLH